MRVTTGGAGALIDYFQRQGENEMVEVLSGDPEDLEAVSEARAQGFGKKYSLRHVIFSPDQELSRSQEKTLAAAWKKEWGADDREALFVKHTRQRADGTKAPHYHLAIAEVDAKGRVLDNRGMYARNEKVARLAELKFGHTVTKGRHNRAVVNQLKADGHSAASEALQEAGITDGKPALVRFSSKAHTVAKREGIDLASIAHELDHVRKGDARATARAFIDIRRNFGVTFDVSVKGHLTMNANGTFIASMNRMMKIDRSQNAEIAKEISKLVKGIKRNDNRDDNKDRRRAGRDTPDPDRNSVRVGTGTESKSRRGGGESVRRTDRNPPAHGRGGSNATRDFGQLSERVNKLTQQPGGRSSRGIVGLLNRASGQIASKRRAQYDIPGNSSVGCSYPPGSPQPAPRLDDPLLLAKLQFGRTDLPQNRL